LAIEVLAISQNVEIITTKLLAFGVFCF